MIYTIVSLDPMDVLTDLHRIARKHRMAVEIVRLPPKNPAPYHWRLAVRDLNRREGADIVIGIALEHLGELEEAIEEAWSAFVKWGLC